jgi:hypothetical protein
MTKMLRLEMDEFKRLVARNDKLLKAADPHLKFRNRPVGGYHSRKEADVAAQLKLREKAGEIRELQEQVMFVLIPQQCNKEGHLLERAAKYHADFTFVDCADDSYHVVDVKSDATRNLPDWVLRRKLMLFVHKITVEEW